MSRPYTIAGLAAAAGVHVEAVRYYPRRDLARLVAACDTNTHDDTCPVLERLDQHRGPPEAPRARATR
jgi:hypothetical protein